MVVCVRERERDRIGAQQVYVIYFIWFSMTGVFVDCAQLAVIITFGTECKNHLVI